jgi:hypothetical protein
MGNISVQILNEEDYEMVMGLLLPLVEQKVIRIIDDEGDEDSIALPGPPLTVEELVSYINKAEAGPIISGDDMKIYFEYLKIKHRIGA